MKIDASVYIVCQNEEKHIQRVLESVKEFDEIIVVDSGSTDRTLEIVRHYTDRIFEHEWMGFAKQKEYAKNLCKHEWVLNLDADEEIDDVLKSEIIDAINSDNYSGLDIRISSISMGKFNSKLSKFNRRIRFFKKNAGFYPEKLVHESINVEGKIKQASGFIYDYGSYDLETHLMKINNYSSLRAQEKSDKGKKSSLIKLLTIFPLAFIKSYIIKRNFLNGKRGFIASVINAFYAFLKEAKLYEWNQNTL